MAFLFVAMVLFSGFILAGEIIPCPIHSQGQRYTVSVTDLYGKTILNSNTVTHAGGGVVEVLHDGGKTGLYDSMFNPTRSTDGRVFNPKLYRRPECPFSLGSRVTYDNVTHLSTNGTVVTSSFEVFVDREMTLVTVPSGTYSVIRIVSIQRYLFGTESGGEAVSISYYAPKIGYSVQAQRTEKTSSKVIFDDKFLLVDYADK